MDNWRDSILSEFVPHVSKLTLVADPDSLLTEEKLAIELRNRGFDLIEFDDPIAFRYAYESKYRSIWDSGEHTDLVVILRVNGSEIDNLPFDLLKSGRKLLFSLGDILPNFSYPVIECLDRMHLDSLYSAQSRYAPDRMGDNATMDFILRHVFGIAAELITNEVELLRNLLRCHYNRIEIPELLSERLLLVLKQNSIFKNWPMNSILINTEQFYEFLQERWPLYLKTIGASELRENDCKLNFKIPGTATLPFGHQDIRIYIDNLFIEGKLLPVIAAGVNVQNAPWVRSGLSVNKEEDSQVRTKRLFASLRDAIPSIDSRHNDWLSFALKWAELLSASHSESSGLEKQRMGTFSSEINTNFLNWIEKNYAGLINLPPTSPAMVHHIPRSLARELESNPKKKIALLVIDGLSLDQWCTVKSIINTQDSTLTIKDSAVFAWVPTLTSISRQAIFAGKSPLYFPTSIKTTDREPALWKQFWEANGIPKLDVAYQKGLGDGDVTSVLDELIVPGRTRVIGLVVNKVDRIMHGMQLGMAGMHNQVRQWCQSGYLTSLIGQLLDKGFDIWLTSDHGNTECKGIGRPSEGVIAETRGERVRIYPSSDLQEKTLSTFPSVRKWNPIGLPADIFPLMADYACAFTTEGETLVGHGGTALEEVIVPFIRFERRCS